MARIQPASQHQVIMSETEELKHCRRDTTNPVHQHVRLVNTAIVIHCQRRKLEQLLPTLLLFYRAYQQRCFREWNTHWSLRTSGH